MSGPTALANDAASGRSLAVDEGYERSAQGAARP